MGTNLVNVKLNIILKRIKLLLNISFKYTIINFLRKNNQDVNRLEILRNKNVFGTLLIND